MKVFQLTMSPGYVQDWTAQDGIREFIQNAFDQESIDSNNTAYIKAATGCLIIENNNSILNHSTLLLGGGDKATNNNLIGGFGEGYKVALLVLIRLGFKIHIANYGLGELWEPEISHSYEFNTDLLKVVCRPLKHGADITKGVSVIITKPKFNFNKVLTTISLKHRADSVISINSSYGQLLDPTMEGGNIYIGGLFITNSTELIYGYNFNPGVLNIGRDRNITDTFNIKYYGGNYLFKGISKTHIDSFITHLDSKIPDLEYINKYSIPNEAKEILKKKYSGKVVISSEEDKQILKDNGIKTSSAIVVSKPIKDFLWSYGSPTKEGSPIVKKSLKDLLGEFLENEKDSLSIEHYEKLKSLLTRK